MNKALIFDLANSVGQEGNSYLFICPQCGKILRFTPSLGLFNCFSCSYSGKAATESDTYEEEPFVLPKEILYRLIDVILNNFTLNRQTQKYLIQRGMLGSFNWQFRTIGLNVNEVLYNNFDLITLEQNYLGTAVNRNSVISPHPTLGLGRMFVPIWEEDKIVNFKTRKALIDSEKSAKYVSMKGSKIGSNCFYLRAFQQSDLIVTEGELKTIGLYNNSYFGFGFSGMAYSQVAIEKLKKLVKETKVKRVFLVFDNDKDLGINYAKLKLHYRALTELKQFCDVAWVVLTKPKNTKIDVDSYLLTYGRNWFDWELERAWLLRNKTYKRLENKVEEGIRSPYY